MITVIIAGGSGTRLWPLSTPAYPKHLLKLTGDRTLLQTAYDRASKLGDTIYIVTEASHAHHVREQLPELPEEAFLIEPGRRGTAHCIVFALDVISRKHDHDEPVAFIHSDHYVRDIEGFARSFAVAGETSTQYNEITLIGIEPTFPATGFGYIKRDGVLDVNGSVYDVEAFKEKPDYNTAQKYLKSGKYLWNCGYFVGSVNTFLNEMKASAPDLQASFDSLAAVEKPGSDEYQQAYLALGNEVIDVALIEKATKLAVVSASFDWMDVGSFKDLHDAVSRDEDGNYFHGEAIHPLDVENIYVRNEEEKPIAVIGLDNIIVVNTPEGILVARKDVSHRTGEIAKKIQSNQ
ncbi:MAG TPA: sugar phosphate nucleotidyltransferase [Candidatus Saccharimonadales bacterium]|nr:sugar phosphate nucleotidyltransferase [Candidatus Saccharimonadales bacterium]